MTRLRPILIGALLVLSGGAATLLVEHHVLPHRPPGPSAALHASLLTQMDSALHLTPAQRDSIHAIFLRRQSLMDSVWGSLNGRMQATLDSVHHDLARVLDPQQRAALHDWLARHRGGPRTGNGSPAH